MRQPSEHGTHLSLRPFPTSFPTRSTSLASLSPKCLTVQGPGPTLSPLSCLMQETESSAWGTTTAPSTPRSTAHTEQGLPVPARPTSTRQIFDSESFTKSSEMSLAEYKSFQCSAHIFLCFLAC